MERDGPGRLSAGTPSCLHNLRDFKRIREIYGEIHARLKPGGVFLNADLINAPTAALHQRYDAVTTVRRTRQGAPAEDLAAMMRHAAARSGGPVPAALEQHLAALRAAGFKDVDSFWKELHRAVYGGYA